MKQNTFPIKRVTVEQNFMGVELESYIVYYVLRIFPFFPF